ncbi:hypothetical protein PINS_up012624 [Pythium insidiosum]|nr:hypothetical protein PINS_up012624 [Pythium insidiosum]
MTTVIPDMITSCEERKRRIFDRDATGQGVFSNGLFSVTDWRTREVAERYINPWNDMEKCIYVDKFLQYPKNFARIASFLCNKTTGDVIEFYYRTKKVVDYKALLREQQLRRRGAGSKNTWSCWNLSACAAICVGVKFPRSIAKLLLHPSNFRSHQASDNVINSAGAQALLNAASDETTETSEPLSALAWIASVSTQDPIQPTDDSEEMNESVLECNGTQDSTDDNTKECSSLYKQKLHTFTAGQQQPFLLDYTSLIHDSSFSTGFEPTTQSVAERLKRFNMPVNEALEKESRAPVLNGDGANDRPTQDTSAARSAPMPSPGNVSVSSKKESKSQRRPKKSVGEPITSSSSVLPVSTSNAVAVSTSAPVPAITAPPSAKKKGGALASLSNAGQTSRNSPKASVGTDDSSSKNGPSATVAGPKSKTNKTGAGTPSSAAVRRGSGAASPRTGPAIPLPAPLDTTIEADSAVSDTWTTGSSSQNAVIAGNTPTASNSGASAAPQAKRVVQKWTDAEKADFLKFFSMHGKDWATLTDSIPTKTAAQIKNYYQNYKNRLGLQEILKKRVESGEGRGRIGSNATDSPRGKSSGADSSSGAMGMPVHGMPSGSGAASELPSPSFASLLHGGRSESFSSGTSSSERYLNFLSQQHQVQMYQMQHQHPSLQQMGPDAGHAYTDVGVIKSTSGQPPHPANVQYIRDPGTGASTSQGLSMHSLHQAVAQAQAHAHAQAHLAHAHAMLQMQQPRSAYPELPHPQYYHHPLTPHGHVPTSAAPSSHSYSHHGVGVRGYSQSGEFVGSGDTGASTLSSIARDGGPLLPSAFMSTRDGPARAMLSLAMINNGSGASGSGGQGSGRRDASSPSRQLDTGSTKRGEYSSDRDEIKRQVDQGYVSSGAHQQDSVIKSEMNRHGSDNLRVNDGRDRELEPLSLESDHSRDMKATHTEQSVQPIRIPASSRMSFSSILNDTESPKSIPTPRNDDRQQLPTPRHEEPYGRVEMVASSAAMQARGMSNNAPGDMAAASPTAHLLPRRTSAGKMGSMASLLNVGSPDHRSPMAQGQRLRHGSNLEHQNEGTHSSADVIAERSHPSPRPPRPTSAPQSRMAARDTSRPSNQPTELDRRAAEDAVLSHGKSEGFHPTQMSSGSSSSAASSSVSVTTAPLPVNSVASSQQTSVVAQAQPGSQDMLWRYHPQMAYEEEAEMLRRAAMEKEQLARRAEEEAARAAAVAAAAARALHEARKARQEVMDMMTAKYMAMQQHQHPHAHQQSAPAPQYQHQQPAPLAQPGQQRHLLHPTGVPMPPPSPYQPPPHGYEFQQHLHQQAMQHHLHMLHRGGSEHPNPNQPPTSQPPSSGGSSGSERP